tara:strand:- start:734 stop:1321 length:588 start_codon:yes stop_codon:yes gene_type:complete
VTVEDPPSVDPGGDAILDAAIRLLADGGLASFTTDRLASEARVSKTSIYRRWSDKKAIFRAVMDRWGARAVVDDLGDFAAELDQWYADRRATYDAEGFRPVAVSLMEVSTHDPEIGAAMAADRRSSWNTMREVLARAIDRGEIDDDIDIDHLEQFFLGPIYYRAVLDGQELDDDTIAAFRRLALAAVGYDGGIHR